jgi:hypothetical protein
MLRRQTGQESVGCVEHFAGLPRRRKLVIREHSWTEENVEALYTPAEAVALQLRFYGYSGICGVHQGLVGLTAGFRLCAFGSGAA